MLKLALDILAALQYAHSSDIAVIDLTPEHIHFQTDEAGNIKAVLAHLDSACECREGGVPLCVEIKSPYCPPEAASGSGRWYLASDMFSFGATMFAMRKHFLTCACAFIVTDSHLRTLKHGYVSVSLV